MSTHPSSDSVGVIGLDTAANRWHAFGPGGVHGIKAGPLKGKKWDNPDIRRLHLVREFDGFLHAMALLEGRPLHIFCEEPLALKNGKTSRLLALSAGALWCQAQGHDLFWHWVDVATWKKAVVGNGNADKPTIRAHAIETFGMEADLDEDYYDAACIREYGRLVLVEIGEMEG